MRESSLGEIHVRILHVIRGLANSSGTTHIVGPLAEHQAAFGHEVSVFHVRKGRGLPVEPSRHGVESHCFETCVPFSNFGYSRAFRAAVVQRMAEFDILHVHAVWNYPTYRAMREAHRRGVPYVVAPQGSFDRWALGQNRWAKVVYRAVFEGPLYNRAARIQTLTEDEVRQCREFGITAKCVIIPNGVHLDGFAGPFDAEPFRESLGLPSNERILLFLGRLHPKKGLDILAEAFGRLVQERRGVTLVVAGSDEGDGYRQRVEHMFRAAGTAGKTVFLGEVKAEQKRLTFRGADAFVLPSYSEGLPVAALEAMSAGLPVVLTRECNIPEAGTAGAGYVVRCDATEVFRALRLLFADEDARKEKGLRARRLVEQMFSWDKIACRTLATYQAILEERGSSGQRVHE